MCESSYLRHKGAHYFLSFMRYKSFNTTWFLYNISLNHKSILNVCHCNLLRFVLVISKCLFRASVSINYYSYFTYLTIGIILAFPSLGHAIDGIGCLLALFHIRTSSLPSLTTQPLPSVLKPILSKILKLCN